MKITILWNRVSGYFFNDFHQICFQIGDSEGMTNDCR